MSESIVDVIDSAAYTPCGRPGHFQIEDEDWEKVRIWIGERYREAEAAGDRHCSVGSEVTFSFVPTGLGLITVVIWMAGTDKEQKLDLTDYASW